jgi:hypothetical protein
MALRATMAGNAASQRADDEWNMGSSEIHERNASMAQSGLDESDACAAALSVTGVTENGRD